SSFPTRRSSDLDVDAAEHVAGNHVTAFEGKLLGLGVNCGGKVFLIRSDASGGGRLHPLLRTPLQRFEHGLTVRCNVARDEPQVVAQLSLIKQNGDGTLAGRGVEEARAQPGRSSSCKRIDAAVLAGTRHS